MNIEYFVVDAFVLNGVLFSGNQAAICVLNNDADISDETKQDIAVENNFSETAFVSHLKDNQYYLRWFTPATEVKFCGHATLATATVLFEKLPDESSLHFVTKFNDYLIAERDRNTGLLSLDFPANVSEAVDLKRCPSVSDIIREIVPENIACKAVQFSKSINYLLLHLDASVDLLQSIRPNFDKLLQIKDNTIGAVIVTVDGEGEFDFHSRFFAPWMGVNEDPVCGSAHTVLSPYWSALKQRTILNAKQESKRGGIIVCELIGERVKISGTSRMVVKGQFHL